MKNISVVAERFIRTLKNKIYENMTAISKNVFMDKLDEIVNKYSNTNHRTVRIKPVDGNTSMYIDFNKENKGLYITYVGGGARGLLWGS